MSYPQKPGGPSGLRPSGIKPFRRDAEFQPQKRSLAVPLVALGGVAFVGLSAFGHGQDVQRNRYDSFESCVHDYSTGQCEEDTPVGAYGGGLHYYGPWYRSGGSGGAADPGPGRGFIAGGLAAGSRSVELGTRGGFGSSGRISARGG